MMRQLGGLGRRCRYREISFSRLQILQPPSDRAEGYGGVKNIRRHLKITRGIFLICSLDQALFFRAYPVDSHAVREALRICILIELEAFIRSNISN